MANPRSWRPRHASLATLRSGRQRSGTAERNIRSTSRTTVAGFALRQSSLGDFMSRGRERRRLKKIARQLSSDDPEFAHRMTTPRAITKVMRWMTLWRALGVLAALFAFLSLVLGQGMEFFVAALTAALLLTYASWHERNRPP
ncbi:DUF3040 domain-containing protein [Saccharopolyspora mangrovi]|uniref:DUF3040 domain-containing protein n=1 Tax=Saccharopolyspora mangrovi TaxID=3082379 RepID=A0ABU6A541_9PSEU|nr:DUF3040 domain-containing protein [Saccharopolyspora sp. S2-29]MEB3366557.1 DUF3040 domain-containing protein [Saccharopolyspora sp. S2-29]